MKQLFVLIICSVFLQPLFAQTAEKKWGLGSGAGVYGATNDGGIGFIPELYFSRYLGPRFDLMLKGGLGLFNTELENDLDFANPFLCLRFKLSGESKKFRPYLYAGPGILADNSESGMNLNLGFGGKYYFRTATALYVNAGYASGIETTRASKTVRDNLWQVTIGMEFDFGRNKSNDQDMDGVPNRKDKCPATPTGVTVDATGCPPDLDGDGIADHVDDCPSVAGVSSLNGCPDKDMDGIADKNDDCPEVAGIANLKGCPDTDGDGVADKDDKCPGTPVGWKVDTGGCPPDTDGDGVADAEDECPSVEGAKEDKGCPRKIAEPKTIDMTTESVYFDSDQYILKDEERPKIDRVAALLKENSNITVKIMGYADNQGSDEYNMALSGKRIGSVVKRLIADGVAETRINGRIIMGESAPAATNDTEQGRAQNRRVEFTLVK